MLKNIFKIALSDIKNSRKHLSVTSQDFKKMKNENSINHAIISNEIEEFKSRPNSLKHKNKHVFEI